MVNLAFFSAFALYLLVLLLIGLYATVYKTPEHDKSATGFLVGNRSLGYWITAISAQASDMSNWLLMGFPAAIYMGGITEFWTAIGLVGGMWLNWKFIAPRLRQETERYNAVTLASYFEARFKDESGALRLLSAAMIILFFTLYLSANIKGIGYLLESAFGINYALGGALGVATVALYTMLGGFIAVAWTDLFQGLFLLIVIMYVPLYALAKIGGFASINLSALQFSHLWSNQPLPLSLLGACGWGLGYFGMPHILSKFMGAKDVEELRKAKYVGIIWQILALTSAAAIGLVGILFFPEGVKGNTELIFIEMAKSLFSPFMAGLVLCAILAAIISTMDSQVLVLAGAVANDLYRNLWRRKAQHKNVQRIYRLAILACLSLAYLLSLDRTQSIYHLVEAAWSGLGSAFGPLVLVALFTRSVQSKAALVGMLGGGISAGWWSLYGSSLSPVAIPAMVIGYGVGLSLIFILRRENTSRL